MVEETKGLWGVNAFKRDHGRQRLLISAEPNQPLVPQTRPGISQGIPDTDFCFFEGVEDGDISSLQAAGGAWVQSRGWEAACARRVPAHSSASPCSDIQDRSIIKIYRKEPLYASFPASHITNGDLRVRGRGSGAGQSPGVRGWALEEGR